MCPLTINPIFTEILSWKLNMMQWDIPSMFCHFNACRNFSATVRRDLMRAKYLSLASTRVQGEAGVLVFISISSAAVM